MLAVSTLDWVDAWELETGEHRFRHRLDAGIAEQDWSEDGEHLAVASWDSGEVVVLDRTGDVVSRFHEKPGQRVVSMSFSPDGRRVASTREGNERIVPTDMPVTIWDSESGEVLSTIDAAASLVAFDPAGKTIATSRRVESIVDIWDDSTGDLNTSIVAPVPITALDFSPDGEAIATGHVDGSIRLWDAASGVQQLSLVGGAGRVEFLAFSPDGAKLATNGADGLARVWALDLDDLVAIAEARLTRGFTEGECRQYLHVARCPAP
jgi:WD40 repeat protein